MILTVTLNTALDLTYDVPALVPHSSHRVTDLSERPGGKGVNVARVLTALGHDSVVTGFAGGTTGTALRELLAALPQDTATLTDALVPVAGDTRRTLAVADRATGDTTQFNEPGPHITAAEWIAFLRSYEKLLTGADAVALCGSLPPGIHVGAYAELIRPARAAGVPVLLDTSGEPLRRGIAARPDLIKPNADELAQLTGAREPLRATRDARRRGAHAVIASLGPDGMLAVTPDGSWQASPPAPVKGNPTGAGDSAVAGLLSGLVEGLSWPDRLRRAVALSTATVLAPTAGDFDRAAYEELLPRVAIEEHAPAA
ncbi:1-phosphofructokinase family hexose kinase [Streptomyces brevispora]|uniref:1-phosphofructokinase family hexose kinase n=1 Tax=Streptomyces brevispora TaxID=887462 RepID=A0A561UZF0_9ACTN|nr:1-phosphofructokinase family hexose kinase [Streptomyces brevispora]TWG04755.1 tagatose 6-phosphate kinase [Streptomyces brevispora]WSC14160.1 1-phosphofructokinase family hexose kinase [Streptomyces brevispora]